MRTTVLRRFIVLAFVAVVVTVASSTAGDAAPPTAYSRALRQICDHALLFEQAHEIGTRAGALELAADIQASGQRRFARITAVPAPRAQQRLVDRWIALERRLTETYAFNYVRIYDLIAEQRTTPEQSDQAANRLERLLHAPDRLRRAAAQLERQLHLSDCTGA